MSDSRLSNPIRQMDDEAELYDDDSDDALDLDNGELLSVNNDEDSGWDTDLEGEGTSKNYIYPGSKEHYTEACKKCEVTPASFFIRNMNSTKLNLAYHGLGKKGVKALCMALATNTHVVTLDLSANDMGDDGTSYVCAMLGDNLFITDLDISENNIGLAGMAHVCNVLQRSGTMKRLVLRGNKLGLGSAEMLADAIATNSGLRCLDVSHNSFDEKSGQHIGPALGMNEYLTEINLGWNNLRGKGVLAIALALKDNSSLKKVNLSWNGFADDGMIVIADALKQNNVIEELDLSANRVTQVGAATLSRGLMENNDLRILRLGQNQLLSEGALTLLRVCKDNHQRTNLIELDMSAIQVNQEFIDAQMEVAELLPDLRVYHGGLGGSPQKAADRPKPMKVLRDHIQQNNMRVLDFFQAMDKDASRSITIPEFITGLQETGIKLRVDELDELMNKLDRNGDGEVDYSELVAGNKSVEKDDRQAQIIQKAKDDRQRRMLIEAQDLPPSRMPSRASSRAGKSSAPNEKGRKLNSAPSEKGSVGGNADGRKLSTMHPGAGGSPSRSRKTSAVMNRGRTVSTPNPPTAAQLEPRLSRTAAPRSRTPSPAPRSRSPSPRPTARSRSPSPRPVAARSRSPSPQGSARQLPQTSLDRPLGNDDADAVMPPKTAPGSVRAAEVAA